MQRAKIQGWALANYALYGTVLTEGAASTLTTYVLMYVLQQGRPPKCAPVREACAKEKIEDRVG